MDDQERPRKDLDSARRKVDRGRPAPSGVRRGTLKGKLIGDQARAGPAKATLAAARRAAADSERSVSPRRELPLPMENPSAADDRREPGSLRLRLRVEGERVTVLSAVTVDVPAPEAGRIRGTDFLEVRAGSDVLTVQPLVDPGLAIGIPDSRDTTEFRGHHIVERPAYELVVRVPIDAVEAVVARDAGARARRDLEITVYRASENLDVDRAEFERARAARGPLTRAASSGRLTIDELRAPAGAESRKAGGDQTAS